MRRNCLVVTTLWLVLLGGYLWYLWRIVPMPNRLWAALAVATVTWTGLVVASGARFTYRDWKARNALARGERPNDGDLVSAVGAVRSSFEVLRSPMSGTECVVYTYDIGPAARGEGNVARDYVGFGMTRCSVQTPFGQFHLGSFPVLEHVPKRRVDERAMAVEYVANTSFEEVNFADLARGMFAIHSQAPPLKKDLRFGEPAVDVQHADIHETLILPGDQITAIGKYVAATNSIVADTSAKGYLRVRRGGDPRRVSAVPWNAIGQLFGGLAIAAVANAAFWLILMNQPR